ncbi:MAG: class II aldolase/adducin family protein, partial [Kiritimatiellia bacterium]
LKTGRVVDGAKSPSSDTATHLEIYHAFKEVGAVVHTHSRFATVWAQALRPIPCYGTTHADVFHGPMPLTRILRQAEVSTDYEANTGRVIVAHFKKNNLDPMALPGVLAGGHGPFTWGADADAAVKNAQLLEALAEMAYYTTQLKADCKGIPGFLCDKHYLRKHGPNAYYGQR